MSKSLGFTVPEPIKTNILNLNEVPALLKSVFMISFLGTFSINFEIPDYWCIGKSVSRGFGVVAGIKASGDGAEISKQVYDKYDEIKHGNHEN